MDQATTAARESSAETSAIASCAGDMLSLRASHPDWFALYDDTDTDSCLRAELVELMATAPTLFARGVCYGKFTMRIEIEAITGRPFE